MNGIAAGAAWHSPAEDSGIVPLMAPAPARWLAGLLLTLLALLPLRAAAADNADILVDVTKDGASVRVAVDCPVDAPRPVVWGVLTDYDHMTAFVSNLQESVVRMRMGNRLQVFQRGKVAHGPLSFSFRNTRDVELTPQTEIRSRVIAGDAMPAAFTTRIEERGGMLHVVNMGTYTPSIWVPPVVGPSLIAAETRKQYGEIRDEIARRAKLTAAR